MYDCSNNISRYSWFVKQKQMISELCLSSIIIKYILFQTQDGKLCYFQQKRILFVLYFKNFNIEHRNVLHIFFSRNVLAINRNNTELCLLFSQSLYMCVISQHCKVKKQFFLQNLYWKVIEITNMFAKQWDREWDRDWTQHWRQHNDTFLLLCSPCKRWICPMASLARGFWWTYYKH